MFRIRQTLREASGCCPSSAGCSGSVLSYASVVARGLGLRAARLGLLGDTALTVLTTVVGAIGRPDRVRRHRERPRRPDGDRDVLGRATCGSGTATASSRRRSPCSWDARLLVLAAAADRRDRARPRRHAGRVLPRRRPLLFLVFLDRFVHRLRPVKVAALVARAGRQALRATVELASTRRRSGADAELDGSSRASRRSSSAASGPGALQAIDDEGLLAWATRHDAVIVMRARCRRLRLVRRASARGARHGAVPASRRAPAGAAASRSGSSGRSSRTRPLRSGSSSTSRSARSRRPSTTRRRRCR